jgi:CHASE3 domain sensor protein
MTPGPNSALQVQIDSLGEQMKQGFDEIKQMLRDNEERTRAIEQQEAGFRPLVSGRIDAVVDKVAGHEIRLTTKSQQINTLEKQVSKMADMYKGLQRFSIAVGTAIVVTAGGFIWALITHQAMVVFK